jgi:hypothetical protein
MRETKTHSQSGNFTPKKMKERYLKFDKNKKEHIDKGILNEDL